MLVVNGYGEKRTVSYTTVAPPPPKPVEKKPLQVVSIRSVGSGKLVAAVYEAKPAREKKGVFLWKWVKDLISAYENKQNKKVYPGRLVANATLLAKQDGLKYVPGIRHNMVVDTTLYG